MKKVWVFISGVVTGMILLFLILIAISRCSDLNNDVILFEEQGECMKETSFKVFQVLDSGDALAMAIEDGYMIATGPVVLFLGEEGTSYYDEQVINVSQGMCARQIGVYRYVTKEGREKTVPVVAICGK